MEKKYRIDEEVKKTLQLLDDMEIIEPNPFLLTRIKYVLDSNNPQPKSVIWNSPLNRIGILIISLLLFLNIYSLVSYLRDDSPYVYSRENYIQKLGAEYYLDSSENISTDSWAE